MFMVLNRLNLSDLVHGIDLRSLGLDRKPFDATPEIVRTAFSVAGSGSDYDKAYNLYSWMESNIQYDKAKFHYRSASQVFRDRKGVCVCQAFLYTTMARIAGLDSSFVDVIKDESGKGDHTCSSVRINGRRILVDTCRTNGFNINHKKYDFWSDERTRNYYSQYFDDSPNFSADHAEVPFGGSLLYAFLSLPLVVSLSAGMLYTFKEIHEGRKPTITSYVQEKIKSTEIFYDKVAGIVEKFSEIEDGEEATVNEKLDKTNFRDHLEHERKLKFPLLVHRLKAIYPERDFSDFCYNQENYTVVLSMYLDHVRSMED